MSSLELILGWALGKPRRLGLFRSYGHGQMRSSRWSRCWRLGLHQAGSYWWAFARKEDQCRSRFKLEAKKEGNGDERGGAVGSDGHRATR